MKITANGIDVHYRVEGDGPWITLSHSLACNLDMWDRALHGRHDRADVCAQLSGRIPEHGTGRHHQPPCTRCGKTMGRAQVFTEAVLGFLERVSRR